MRMQRPVTLILTLSCLLVLNACQTHQASSSKNSLESDAREAGAQRSQSPVVARVGEVVITEADVTRRLSDLSPISRARYQSPERRQELISSLIRFELLAAEARRRGHHKNPDVALAYKQAMVRELLGKEVRNLVKMSDISDEDTVTYYQEHLSDYERPALVRASHILLPSKKAAIATLKEYQLRVKTKPKEARVIFGDLAAQRSHDQETKARRGDVQYFTSDGKGHGDRRFPQSDVPAEAAQAASALTRVGDVTSSPVRSLKGWHLIQRTGGKRAFKRPLKEVQTEIRNHLFRARKSKALEDYVTQLKSSVTITIDDQRLNALKLPKTSTSPKRPARALPFNFPKSRPSVTP
jgi:peptidyl-prolyl cis-trans isomerase C